MWISSCMCGRRVKAQATQTHAKTAAAMAAQRWPVPAHMSGIPFESLAPRNNISCHRPRPKASKPTTQSRMSVVLFIAKPPAVSRAQVSFEFSEAASAGAREGRPRPAVAALGGPLFLRAPRVAESRRTRSPPSHRLVFRSQALYAHPRPTARGNYATPLHASRTRPTRTRAVTVILLAVRVRNGIDLRARFGISSSVTNEAGPPKKFLRRMPRLLPARPRSTLLLRTGLKHFKRRDVQCSAFQDVL